MQFEMSADAKILRSVLQESEVGQTITYDELSRAIGRDVRQHAISALGTARRGLLRERGYVFGVERNVGLTRLSDELVVDSIESDRRRLQRTANRSLRKLETVKFDELPEEKKKAHVVASAQLGVLSMFSKASSARKIESAVKDQTSLAIGDTLRMFGG